MATSATVSSTVEKVASSRDLTREPPEKQVSLQTLIGRKTRELKAWAELIDNAQHAFHKRWKDDHRSRKMTVEDFHIKQVLGEGAYGKVALVVHRRNKEVGAMKVMRKADCKKVRDHILSEKRVLYCLDWPFLVHMYYHFQDRKNLYLVLEFINGGDFFNYFSDYGPFKEEKAQFYSAEVLLGLEYLHMNQIVYRDLKPENMLLDCNGHLKLTDMGFAKHVPSSERTWTVCGTPEYMAPEIMSQRGYNRAVDYWALGIFLYECVSGGTPFYHENEDKMFDKASQGLSKFPSSFQGSRALCDLLTNLLQPDLSRRYGILKYGILDIKLHPFYRNIDWIEYHDLKAKPPYKPDVHAPDDVAAFADMKGEQLDLVYTGPPKEDDDFAEF